MTWDGAGGGMEYWDDDPFNRPWPSDWSGLFKEVEDNERATRAAAWEGPIVRDYLARLLNLHGVSNPPLTLVDAALDRLLSVLVRRGQRLVDLFCSAGDEDWVDAPGVFARRLSWVVGLMQYPNDARVADLQAFMEDYAQVREEHARSCNQDNAECAGDHPTGPAFDAIAKATAVRRTQLERSPVLQGEDERVTEESAIERLSSELQKRFSNADTLEYLLKGTKSAWHPTSATPSGVLEFIERWLDRYAYDDYWRVCKRPHRTEGYARTLLTLGKSRKMIDRPSGCLPGVQGDGEDLDDDTAAKGGTSGESSSEGHNPPCRHRRSRRGRDLSGGWVPFAIAQAMKTCKPPGRAERDALSIYLYNGHHCAEPEHCLAMYWHEKDRVHALEVVFRDYPNTRRSSWAADGVTDGRWPFAISQGDLKEILRPVVELRELDQRAREGTHQRRVLEENSNRLEDA